MIIILTMAQALLTKEEKPRGDHGLIQTQAQEGLGPVMHHRGLVIVKIGVSVLPQQTRASLTRMSGPIPPMEARNLLVAAGPKVTVLQYILDALVAKKTQYVYGS